MQCKCGNEIVPVRGGKFESCIRCFREATLSDSLNSLLVPKVFRNSRLENFSKVKLNTEKSLFIFGPTGTGKTHLAVALLVNDILETPSDRSINVEFVSMLGLLNRIKATFSKNYTGLDSNEIMQHFCNVKNLYIDDIGVEVPTDFALSSVYQIIDHRWGNELRTVFTSNYDLDSLAEKFDPRISSRIRGMCSGDIIHLGGNDRRK